MKIAFDAKRAFRNYSGLGNYSRTVINLLHEFHPEHTYSLYTPDTRFSGRNFPPPKSLIVSPEKQIHKKLNSYWRSYYISKLLEKDRPDIYHGLSHELPYNIENTGVKSIVTIHDLIFFRYPELYKAIDRQIYKKKWKHAVKVADKIIAISQQTKEDICNYLNVDDSKIEVIYQSYNPVFGEKLTEEEKDSIRKKFNLPETYLLYVGTIEKRKNLLEILKALHAGNIQLPLVVVGKPKREYNKMVTDFINEKKLKNIIFLHQLPTADLPGVYQNSSMLIYPSSFEGFGLPVLEALQSGVPVIAAKGSCLEETGGPDSVYVDPFNTEEFADAIKQITESESISKKMISKGLSFSKKFNPENFVKKLIEVYESVL